MYWERASHSRPVQLLSGRRGRDSPEQLLERDARRARRVRVGGRFARWGLGHSWLDVGKAYLV